MVHGRFGRKIEELHRTTPFRSLNSLSGSLPAGYMVGATSLISRFSTMLSSGNPLRPVTACIIPASSDVVSGERNQKYSKAFASFKSLIFLTSVNSSMVSVILYTARIDGSHALTRSCLSLRREFLSNVVYGSVRRRPCEPPPHVVRL
jgi:hypothetical protein